MSQSPAPLESKAIQAVQDAAISAIGDSLSPAVAAQVADVIGLVARTGVDATTKAIGQALHNPSGSNLYAALAVAISPDELIADELSNAPGIAAQSAKDQAASADLHATIVKILGAVLVALISL